MPIGTSYEMADIHMTTRIDTRSGLPESFPEEYLAKGVAFSDLEADTYWNSSSGDFLVFGKSDLRSIIGELIRTKASVVNLSINEHRRIEGIWKEEQDFHLPYDLGRLNRLGFDEACIYTLAESARILDPQNRDTKDSPDIKYSLQLIAREEWDQIAVERERERPH